MKAVIKTIILFLCCGIMCCKHKNGDETLQKHIAVRDTIRPGEKMLTQKKDSVKEGFATTSQNTVIPSQVVKTKKETALIQKQTQKEYNEERNTLNKLNILLVNANTSLQHEKNELYAIEAFNSQSEMEKEQQVSYQSLRIQVYQDRVQRIQQEINDVSYRMDTLKEELR